MGTLQESEKQSRVARVLSTFSSALTFEDPDKNLKILFDEAQEEVRVNSRGGLHESAFLVGEPGEDKVGIAYDRGGVKAVKIVPPGPSGNLPK